MTANALACPRCSQWLAAFEMRTGTIRTCGCGQWLDNDAAHRLVLAELPDAAHDLLRPSGPPPPIDPAQALACPECQAALVGYTTKEEMFGVAVSLDVCPRHGTWFDAGEAWTLFQSVAVKRGALDYELRTALREAAWAKHEEAFQRWVLRRM
jgi:Zn-finger nucleic acid-binding protein